MLPAKRQIVVILTALWLTAVTVGMSLVVRHSNTVSAIGKSPSTWPLDCQIQQDAARNTLLMFIHPLCPCTRASLRELARTLAQTGDRLDAYIVVFQPVNKPNNWSHTDLWNAATHIPSVKVISDVDSVIAFQFRVQTSGHVLLYDTTGQLRFSGGITAGRGHDGDNIGHSAIVSLVRGKGQYSNTCSVFGCPIVELK